MVSTTPLTSAVVHNRRTQLRRWIDTYFDGNQAAFGASTNDGKSQVNQGEVSGLLKEKSFGEKRARRLEQQAHMPPGYLESTESPTEYPSRAAQQVQEPLHGIAAVPIARPQLWPFQLVTQERLADLKRALGPRQGTEAMRDLDKYLDVLVAKWERELAGKKKSAGS